METNFLTVENMVECISVFVDHMQAKYTIDVNRLITAQELREMFLDEMEGVRDEFSDSNLPVRTLNNYTMNKVKQRIQKLVNKPQPARSSQQVKALERDQVIYGDRRVVYADSINRPVYSGGRPDSQAQLATLDALVNARDVEAGLKAARSVPDPCKPVSESALTEDDFFQRLKKIEDERESIAVAAAQATPPTTDAVDALANRFAVEASSKSKIQDTDPKAVIQPMTNGVPQPLRKRVSSSLSTLGTLSNAQTVANIPNSTNIPNMAAEPPAPFQVPRPLKQVVTTRYLSISGADRDWSLQRNRYNFSVQLGGLKENSARDAPKDVVSVAITCVVLPMEAVQPRITAGSPIMPTARKNANLPMSYPYLVVRISELGSAYDGTNAVVRDCMAKLTYDTSYSSASGRGFLILKPMQDEERIFAPTPLASLSRVTIQVLKPNGAIFSNSIDNYEVVKIEHEPFNPHLVKLVLDKFFDANEFSPGDNIVVSGMHFTRTDAPLSRVEAFVNRVEGHEVVELGDANDAGYYRTLYVLAPGTLDQDIGRVVHDTGALSALNEYNGALMSIPSTGAETNGKMINSTLQTVFAMKIKVLEPRS